MRMMSIASGSSGNCIYVGSDNTHILIDAGVSRKRISEGLKTIGLSMSDISGIMVTHEHIDHIKGLGVISRKDSIPVYTSIGTAAGILKTSSIGEFDENIVNSLHGTDEFRINDLVIKPFRTSHDANEPMGFRIEHDGKSAAVVTDLGTYDDYIIDNLQKLDSLLIESNHDIRMLQAGAYPYMLKKRILSDSGHLSNEACGRLLSKLLNDKMRHIFLGHLSHENNLPELAFETVKLEVDMDECKYKAKDFDIRVASRDVCSEVVEF